jgi:cob(I)alamin adenosyltransferase
MVRVYTKSGDQGQTSLFDGSRVDKDDLRVEAYGTVDELNSILSHARLSTPHDDVRGHVREIQRFLFVLGADLATPPGDGKAAGSVRRTSEDEVTSLEHLIDDYWARLSDLDSFVVPGETVPSAHFHVARTVCRRAERQVIHLARSRPVTEAVVHYLNRLSDLLFTWGRFEDEGVAAPDRIRGLGARP